MTTVKAVCAACRGTGLYRGFAEPHGVAVVCLKCDGSGCELVQYEPFVERLPRTDVQFVSRSRGTFIGTGVGPAKHQITYVEFLAGKRPV